jgi:hypothetical protein
VRAGLSVGEAVENDHMDARRFLVPSGLPDDMRGRLPGDLWVIGGTRRTTNTRVPQLGEDTGSVLAEGNARRIGRRESTAVPQPVNGAATLFL